MLAADPQLEVGLRRAALVDRDLHQPGDRVVERLERVEREDLVFDVLEQEAALGVVLAVAERHLRQVVRAETEEVRLAGDLVGGKRAAWHLDHRAELVVDFDTGLALHGLRLGLEERAWPQARPRGRRAGS